MSNDIDSIVKQTSTAAQAPSAQPARNNGAANTPAASASSSDTVKLTDSARALHELERAVADAPVVDSQRVSDLARAVASGEYHVDAEQVAEKILQFDREFGAPE